MREIKYRAWDKENQRFMDKDSFVVDPDGTVAEVWNLSELHGDISDEVELMQYTGLKDVNGVEIFEGDIVIRIDDSSDKVRLVEYTEIGARFTSNRVSMYQPDGRRNYQIIGNKFQNPELLEVAE